MTLRSKVVSKSNKPRDQHCPRTFLQEVILTITSVAIDLESKSSPLMHLASSNPLFTHSHCITSENGFELVGL